MISVGDLKISPKAKTYLKQVIDSNRLSYGPFHRRFEEAFAKEHGCKHAIFLNSGTSALHIAVQALKEHYGWREGDEVIVPATTFVASVNVVLHNRLHPILADVDPLTFTIDPKQIEKKITKRTVAIMPVHVMGQPADMGAILQIAKRNNLKIIEDSCETMFAAYRGKKVGSFGDIGCFSTYLAHYLVTGVGGLATTNDTALAGRMRSLMNHGRDTAYLNIDDDEKEPWKVASRRFRFNSIGHSFRATEFEAALGLAQLEDKDAIVRARVANATYLAKKLDKFGIQLPVILPDRDNFFMTFPLVSQKKNAIVNHLERNGIETRDLLPLVNQPCYKGMFVSRDYPVADRLLWQGFYVGCHQYLTRKNLDFMAAKIKEALK